MRRIPTITIAVSQLSQLNFASLAKSGTQILSSGANMVTLQGNRVHLQAEPGTRYLF